MVRGSKFFGEFGQFYFAHFWIVPVEILQWFAHGVTDDGCRFVTGHLFAAESFVSGLLMLPNEPVTTSFMFLGLDVYVAF
jgi:hypothetical protein